MIHKEVLYRMYLPLPLSERDICRNNYSVSHYPQPRDGTRTQQYRHSVYKKRVIEATQQVIHLATITRRKTLKKFPRFFIQQSIFFLNVSTVAYWSGWYLPGAGGQGTCPGHWISRYGTKLLILCWCVTTTPSRPPHWLYLQIPFWYWFRQRVPCASDQLIIWLQHLAPRM